MKKYYYELDKTNRFVYLSLVPSVNLSSFEVEDNINPTCYNWGIDNGVPKELGYTSFYLESIEKGKEIEEQRKYDLLRKKRKTLLEAFDKWEKAVLRGREVEDDTIMQWYQDILDLKESAFEKASIPERIKYYN